MAKENVITNLDEKLSRARELCPGMDEDVYAIADYMSKVTGNKIVPHGLAMSFLLTIHDIENGANGFAGAESKELPRYLVERKNQVLNQAVYFPQIIDAITDEDFSNEFRAICKEFLGYNPPKRVNAEIKTEYPAYIMAAIDWWANAILSPKLDTGETKMPTMLFTMAANTGKSYSAKEISIFKETLAEEITKEMEGRSSCSLSVEYGPCHALEVAGEKIGVNSLIGYPWKTTMRISEDEIIVSAGYGAGYQRIWSKSSK